MIKEKILQIIKKKVFGKYYNSKTYTDFLRKQGCRIGNRTVVFVPNKTTIDYQIPWMIEIGDDVQITEGVKILTHGYDWSVLKGLYGDILGSVGKVTIGNNVFIGMDVVITKGTTIGDNVIIGAGSVVTKDIPQNSVAVGNPCRVIMSIDDYYMKRKKMQYEEASELVREYRNTHGGKNPNEKDLAEFFWLFSDSYSGVKLPRYLEEKMQLVGGGKSYQVLRNHVSMFSSFNELLKSIENKVE